MGGRGPTPKDPSKLIRRNIPTRPLKTVVAGESLQPSLLELFGEINPLTQAPWSQASELLWLQLRNFPTTENLLPAQWSNLGRAFMLDDAFLSGQANLASEVRLQFAKYGIAPDDLARARVKVVRETDEVSNKKEKSATPARKARVLNLVKDVNQADQVG